MKTRNEIDRQFVRQALKAEAVTPAHSAAEGEMDEEAARRHREHVQHEVDPVDPYLHEAPEVAHVDLAELGKAYDRAVDVPVGYPPLRRVAAEEFRRGPLPPGHSPGWPVPVPTATLTAAMVTRPVLTDGQARPCVPGAC